MRPATLTLAAAAVLGLSACGPSASMSTRGICTAFPAAASQAVGGAAGDNASAVDDCLHRWAYTLAKSTDPADQVASATVAACSTALSRWNQQNFAPAPGPSSDGAPEPMSLVTGEPTNAFAAHHEFAQNRALFYVVQARAGHCAPPPAPKGGFPAG